MFSFYLLLSVGINLGLCAFCNFFHFHLGHGLEDLEQWHLQNRWMIISLSKLMAFYIFWYSINLGNHSYSVFKKFWRRCFYQPRGTFFLIIVFAVSFLWVFLAPRPTDNWQEFSIWSGGKSLLGVIIYYLVDLLVLGAVLQRRPIKSSAKWINYAGFFLLMTFSHHFNWLLTPNSFYLGFNLLLLLWLRLKVRVNIFTPLSLVILVLGPLAAFAGFDPFNQNIGQIIQVRTNYLWLGPLLTLLLSQVYMAKRERESTI